MVTKKKCLNEKLNLKVTFNAKTIEKEQTLEMALQQTAFSDKNQPATIYPALSAVKNENDENSTPQNIIQLISKNIRQFLNILPG